MYIMSEDTPNPNVKKFMAGRDVTGNENVYEYTHEKQASNTPLVKQLFEIEGVSSVFLGRDFLSITKTESVSWQEIRLDIIDVITEFYLMEQPLFLSDASPAEEITYDPADKEIVEEILEILETKVRPAVAQDGGDIRFSSYKEGVVFVSLKGACAGCPSSSITLKNGIENMLKHYIPEVIAVQAV